LKVLVAGDWHSGLHEEPVSRALRLLGHETICFKWHTYFERQDDTSDIGNVLLRLQNKYLIGPSFNKLNADLIAQAVEFQPDLIFIYRGTHITAATLRQISGFLPRTCIAGYNNDDPFSPAQPAWLWRHFKSCLPEYDVAVAYRSHNIGDFSSHGARKTYLLKSWFVPEYNHPEELTAKEKEQLGGDVCFIGHFEDDGRLAYLEDLAGHGVRLRLFGPEAGWDARLSRSRWLASAVPVKPVRGSLYNKALCASKIALCFFSRLNRDTYTRRCFEIPAAGTMLMSEYSPELAAMFTEGVEAEYFRSRGELVEKVRFYLDHPEQRLAVARAGLERVHRDGHDVNSRIHQFLDWLGREGMLTA
jgi:spore maturation protein CgeB